MRYSNKLVLRVNEVFHDLEQAEYDQRHPEILHGEANRWNAVAARFIAASTKPITVLDVGCGTGFVARQVGPRLKEADRLICADLSAGMLEACQKSLRSANLRCGTEFLKLPGDLLPLNAASVDVVTMNSVLHHIPELSAFCSEVDRILKPHGRIIIGHEPNRGFYTSLFLRLNSRVVGVLFTPRQALAAFLRQAGLLTAIKKLLRRFSPRLKAQNTMLDAVNVQLLQEGVIQERLTNDELTAIVDIHSPTAGGFHRDRGIDIHHIQQAHLPGYAVEHVETYNHLGDRTSTANRLTRAYDDFLRRRWPKSGATLMAVMTKP